MIAERWLPVVGYETRNEVSSHGRVRSLDRMVWHRKGHYQPIKGRILKTPVAVNGYPVCNLGRKTHTVHRLVAIAFLGPCPPGHEVAHADGDRANSHLDNLRWSTAKDNQADKDRHGTMLRGEACSISKLNAPAVLDIRKRYASGGVLQKELALEYGVSRATIWAVVNRKNWAHL